MKNLIHVCQTEDEFLQLFQGQQPIARTYVYFYDGCEASGCVPLGGVEWNMEESALNSQLKTTGPKSVGE